MIARCQVSGRAPDGMTDGHARRSREHGRDRDGGQGSDGEVDRIRDDRRAGWHSRGGLSAEGEHLIRRRIDAARRRTRERDVSRADHESGRSGLVREAHAKPAPAQRQPQELAHRLPLRSGHDTLAGAADHDATQSARATGAFIEKCRSTMAPTICVGFASPIDDLTLRARREPSSGRSDHGLQTRRGSIRGATMDCLLGFAAFLATASLTQREEGDDPPSWLSMQYRHG